MLIFFTCILILDVNEAPSDITLSATSVYENEPDTLVGRVTVDDPDIGQRHRCTVHDRVVNGNFDSGRTSKFFSVDASLNLKTLSGLNFEAHHSLDIWINCSDIVADSLFRTQLFTIFVKGKLADQLLTCLDVRQETKVEVCW